MTVKHFFTALLCAAALLPVPVFAQKPVDAKPQTVARTAWDGNYLYLTFQVDDINIQGTQTAPMSQPQQDDGVAVYLDFGSGSTPDAASHAMIVSAAGGFTFLRGDAAKKNFLPDKLFTIKYAVTLQGTLNRSDDRDRGYTVEMAIPWAGVGQKPEEIKAGFAFRYNAVVRARGGKLTSLSPRVVTEENALNPKNWQTLTLAPTITPPDPSIAVRIAKGASPLIDGVPRQGEWADESRVVFDAPLEGKDKPIVQAAPVAPTVPLPILKLSPALAQMDGRIFTRYRVDFQADPRKSTPFRGILSPNINAVALKDQPVGGMGPWFSADRVGWHRANFAEMRRTGIDAALVEMPAAPGVDSAGDKALLTMASALREMRYEAQAAPTVALSLDLSPFAALGDDRPDMATNEGRALVYANIARFMRIVAPELRTESQLPVENGGGRVYPVFLSGKSGVTNWDAKIAGKDWVTDLRSRFASEFGEAGGATLLFVGDASFAEQSEDFAAILPAQPNALGTGLLPVAVVAPGMIAKSLLPRRDGETYRAGWTAAAYAQWVIVDSWNDFARATEIAGSRQHGTRYLDMTRIALAQRLQKTERGIKWIAHTAPRRMAVGQSAQVDITLQNGARLPVRASDGIALSYRWLQNGKVVGEILTPQPLRTALFPGDVATVPLNAVAAAQNKDGRIEPLAPGNYYLQVDFVVRKPNEPARYFSDDGVHSLSIPIQIVAEPENIVEWNGTTANTLLFSGGYYPTLLRVRWMGKEPLTPTDAQVTYQILSENGAQTIASGSFPLDAPLAPGRWGIVRVPLRLTDGGGAPLVPALPEGANRAETGGFYRIRWLLTHTNATEILNGEFTDVAAVYPADAEARVLPPKDSIDEISASGRTTVDVTVINRGFTRWARGTASVGHHWYYADGIEAQWKPVLLSKIDRDVEPGQSVTVPVVVIAPERPGSYNITFDVTRNGDSYLSTRPISRVGDIAVAPVRVTDGRLEFVNLAKFFDVDAVSYEGKPGDGDLNGVGGTLPGEFFVPDRFGVNAQTVVTRTTTAKDGKKTTKTKTVPPPPYPSGYQSEVSAARRVSFLFGNVYDGAKNAVACKGQAIPVEAGRYVGLNIAALSVGGGDRRMPVTLRYKDKSTQVVSVVVGDWGRSSTNTEPAAIATPIRRTPNGDTLVPSTLYHLILPVDVGKELIGITLTDDTKIKVFAITLEK